MSYYPSPSDTDAIVRIAEAQFAESSFLAVLRKLLSYTWIWWSVWIAIRYTGIGSKAGLDKSQRINWDSRVVSQLHAMICIYLSFDLFFPFVVSVEIHPIESAFGSSAKRDSMLLLTAGYLVYDLVLCIVHRAELGDPLTYLHHVLIIAAFVAGVYTKIGCFYMASFLVNEVSTIFLNANYFMAVDDSLKGSRLYKINGALLLVSFLVFRTLHNTVVVGHMFWSSWRPLLGAVNALPVFLLSAAYGLSLLSLGHVALNIVWFVDILRAVRRKIVRPESPRDVSHIVRAQATASAAAEAKKQGEHGKGYTTNASVQTHVFTESAAAKALRSRMAGPAGAAAKG